MTFFVIWQSYDKTANSQNIYDNLKTYLLTKCYDHLLDVLWQLVALYTKYHAENV